MLRALLVLLLSSLALGACAMLSPELVSEDNRVWIRRGPVLLRCADLASEGRPEPVCVAADGANPETRTAPKAAPAPARQRSRQAPSPLRGAGDL